jgi:hypothetical protein
MQKNALGVRVSGLETCKKNSRVEKGQHSPPRALCGLKKVWVLICKGLEGKCKRIHWSLKFRVWTAAKK